MFNILPLFFFFQPGQLGLVHCTDSCSDLRQPASSLMPRVRPVPADLPVTAHCGRHACPRWPMGWSLSLSAVPWREHQRTKVLQIHQGAAVRQSRFYGFISSQELLINNLCGRLTIRQIFPMNYDVDLFIFRFYNLTWNTWVNIFTQLFQIFFHCHFSYQLQ